MQAFFLSEWIAYFIIYGLIGWVFESSYVSLRDHRLTNRGILNGPFLPLYGFGGIVMMLCAMPVADRLPLVFIFGALGATGLELCTGILMRRVFHISCWNYSSTPFNLNGLICLKSSVAWGLWFVVLANYIHLPLKKVVLGMDPGLLLSLELLFFLFLFADFYVSVRFRGNVNYVTEQN